MGHVLVWFSLVGILNSLLLVLYLVFTKKGTRKTNLLLAGLILALSVRIGKSVLFFVFSDHIYGTVLTLGLSGFLMVGPLAYFFVRETIAPAPRLGTAMAYHFLPALLFFSVFLFISYQDLHHLVRNLVYHSILLHYIVYLVTANGLLIKFKDESSHLVNQLSIMLGLLALIWMAYLLNSIIPFFHYLHGGILYCAIVYVSFLLILNKGELITSKKNIKYEKSGLAPEDIELISRKLEWLIEAEAPHLEPNLTLAKLAKRLKVTTNALSQVINSHFGQSFNSYIAKRRIQEAKRKLLEEPSPKNITEIAYQVGFNSLSTFYKAFNKEEGCTPSQFKKKHLEPNS